MKKHLLKRQPLLKPNAASQPSNYALRYFITLSYDGTAYHGWQKQPNANSVQETLECALRKLIPSLSSTTGAGRTDTGVHAKLMVVHFDSEQAIDAPRIAFRLNRILPPDIVVHDIKAVREDAHARFTAQARTYHYFVYTGKEPFLRHYAMRLPYEPDYALMNEAAKKLLRITDFTSFAKMHTDTKTNICHVTYAAWSQETDGRWRFTITADRFLRNMVRAIVGTLLDVGRGKITMQQFEQIIYDRNRQAAGDSVEAQALFLVDIQYPKDIYLS